MNAKTKKILIFGGIAAIVILWLLKDKLKPIKPEAENINTNNNNNMFIDNNDFIRKFYAIALKIEKTYKIPALFLTAQAALESNFGKSSLTKNGFNFGGIKAKKDQDYILTWTREHVKDPNKYPNRDKSKDKPAAKGKTSILIQDKFAKYPDLESGIKGYINILLLPRYKEAFNFVDPLKFAAEIGNGGYWTDTAYLPKLEKMIIQVKNTI